MQTESSEVTMAGEGTLPQGGKPEALSPGTTVGRYVILERIGSGSMGIVYAAFDPELDRKLALKLLRPGRSKSKTEERKLRLQREAQALAQLQHPNVVAVHDVGTFEKHVFIAMEYIDGPTLREWLTEKRRAPREVLKVLIAAGEGLVAAHQKGMIHRDFKPDNVMLGSDGRVRVMDFGLARTAGEYSSEYESRSSVPEASLGGSLSVELTNAGSMLGTPAYMSPEQHRGEPADARSDQFAFCVVLHEALYGRRPFKGKTAAALSVAIIEGHIEEPPAGAKVPGWVRKALLRGLATRPSERWPDVAGLLAELRRDPSRTRKRWGAVAGIAVLVGGGIGAGRIIESSAIAACEEQGASIDQIWDDEAKQRLQARVMGTGREYAGATHDFAAAEIDTYVQAWTRRRTETCLAGRAAGGADPVRQARVLSCLAERRESLETLLTTLEQPGDAAVSRLVSATAGLPPIAQCDDDVWLQRYDGVTGPGVKKDPAADRARSLAIEAETLQRLGRYDASVAKAREAVAKADETGRNSLRARTRLRLGSALMPNGPYAEAAEVMRECHSLAHRAGDDVTAGVCAGSAAIVHGQRLNQIEIARLWEQVGDASLERAGHDDSLARATWHLNAGALDLVDGAAPAAIEHIERARDIRCSTLGAAHPLCTDVKISLARALMRNGDWNRASELLDRALLEVEAREGPHHPVVADVLQSQAQIAHREQREADSEALARRAVAILERAVDDDSAILGKAYANLANAVADDKVEEQIELLGKATVIIRKHYGDEHPWVAQLISNRGFNHMALEQYDLAKAAYREALEIQERVQGKEHVDLIKTLNNLADAHAESGEHVEAVILADRALAIREASRGPEHPQVASALLFNAAIHRKAGAYDVAAAKLERAMKILEGSDDASSLAVAHSEMGRVRRSMGQPQRSVHEFRRALEVREREGGSPVAVANAKFNLGKAMWEAKGDRVHARELVESARAEFERSKTTNQLTAADEWLSAHR